MPTQLELFDPDRLRENGDGITPGEAVADQYQGDFFESLAENGMEDAETLVQGAMIAERHSHGNDPQFMRELENGLRGIIADWECNEESIRDFWGLSEKGENNECDK